MSLNGGTTQETKHERICITSTGRTALDPVDPRFGRCSFFLIVDGRKDGFEAVENHARSLGNGAGIQAAQEVANLRVTAVITGDLGPSAFRVLFAAGIRMFHASGCDANRALSEYREGKLSEITAPTGQGHHGMGGHGPR
jgi:predicted Fe-Mo cluster-binding NifX family protein